MRPEKLPVRCWHLLIFIDTTVLIPFIQQSCSLRYFRVWTKTWATEINLCCGTKYYYIISHLIELKHELTFVMKYKVCCTLCSTSYEHTSYSHLMTSSSVSIASDWRPKKDLMVCVQIKGVLQKFCLNFHKMNRCHYFLEPVVKYHCTRM